MVDLSLARAPFGSPGGRGGGPSRLELTDRKSTNLHQPPLSRKLSPGSSQTHQLDSLLYHIPTTVSPPSAQLTSEEQSSSQRHLTLPPVLIVRFPLVYPRRLSSSQAMSTQPLLQRTAAKRIALPVRQEPKVRSSFPSFSPCPSPASGRELISRLSRRSQHAGLLCERANVPVMVSLSL